jgi:hypothetical protein
MIGKPLRSVACGLLLVATVTSAHAAADPQRIAGLLAAAVAASGEGQLTYGTTGADGADITIADVKLSLAARNGAITVPKVVISGAAERASGGFSADSVTFDGGSATSSAGGAKWHTATARDVIVPSADEVKARARVRPFTGLTLGTLALNEAGATDPVSVATLDVALGDVAEGAPVDVVVKASGASVPATFVANPIVLAILDRLGYDKVDADVTMESVYDPDADTVDIRSLTIDAADIGTIAMTGKFSGLSLHGLADPSESKAARAAARLNAMTVRFDDGGFVKRMLAMQADMLGGTPDDVREALVDGALPVALSFVDNASFRDSFLVAVGAFLEDPRSLTLTAAPKKPVPLGQVVRTALHSPLSLADLLAPDVVANH